MDFFEHPDRQHVRSCDLCRRYRFANLEDSRNLESMCSLRSSPDFIRKTLGINGFSEKTIMSLDSTYASLGTGMRHPI